MRHVPAIAALLASLGCAPAGAEPLVCDPARQGELAFLYHVSEGLGIGVVDVLPIDVALFSDHPGQPLHW